jgi:predicted DNA-binding protein (UPF0251 family)
MAKGAKGKYAEWLTPDGLLRIQGWAMDGLTNEQIAHNMGISRETLNQWQNRFADISDALKKGKEVVDREVENALFERACGCIKTLQKPIKVKKEYYDEQGRKCYEELIKYVNDQVYIPPDTTAQIFWLKNRKRDVWGDKAQTTDDVKQDDGFIEALNGSAEKDWSEDETGESDI